jgi:hypothetical protein
MAPSGDVFDTPNSTFKAMQIWNGNRDGGWLLKRDLDPANDNGDVTPMWLSKVA